GMVRVAAYTASRFKAAGYRVLRQDFPFQRYSIDYAAARKPMLRRDDGVRFKAESGFDLTRHTPAAGRVCRVTEVADVGPGDCGFIPFGDASPEWKNSPFVSVGGALDQIVAQGGAGAIVQGDPARDLVFSLRVRRPLPTVVAVARPEELIGRLVRMRALGVAKTATGHNVVAIRRPPSGSSSYVMLLAHADGWFQAAADNGSGSAAVLRAAELLAASPPNVCVIAALTDAEELGLIGADRLAAALDAGLPVGDGGAPIRMDDIKAVVNLDACSARASDVQDAVRGIARQDAAVFSWRAMVSSENPLLTGAFLARFAANGVLGAPVPAALFKPVENGSFGGRHRTDVAAFAERGIPFVWPVVGYPEYHTDGDGLNAVDPADLEAVAVAAAEFVADLAVLPLPRVPEPLR
ncbi:MAG: M28 family peptidase, partial [Actinomycetota bacterium]